MYLVVSVASLDLPFVCALNVGCPGVEATSARAEKSWL